MLRIDPVDTIQKPVETTFKNRVTSEKMATDKLMRLAENFVVQDAAKTIIPENARVVQATNYLATEAAKITSSKLDAQKMERLANIL